MRASLLQAVADADRVVLLGDVLELRHGPPREAVAAARAFFEDLGHALAGRELIVVAGNHDHALVEPWLARRGEAEEAPLPLGLEQLIEPAEASSALARIAAWASPARTLVAYPGLWVRPDVYACHGHYLDCHLTVPTLERLSMAAMSRLLGRAPSTFQSVGEYESLGAPVYAWRDAVARDAHTSDALNGMATVAAWQALGGARDGARPGTGARSAQGRRGSRLRGASARVRRWALVRGFPLAVAGLNRAGFGPLRSEISGVELRRAGLQAMGEVAARLGLEDAYVVFGHTHRAGPLPGDEPREWRGREGARLINAGNWTYAKAFLRDAPGESPYWPGTCVVVEGSGPPRLERLLQDRSHAEIMPIRA
jgi:predicted phosphodiesterase